MPQSIDIDTDKVVKEFDGKSWRERLKIFDLYLEDFASAFLTPRELKQLLRGTHVRDPLPDPDVVTFCAMLLRNFIGLVLRNLEAREGWGGRAAGAEHALLLLMSVHADHVQAGQAWEGEHGASSFGRLLMPASGLLAVALSPLSPPSLGVVKAALACSRARRRTS